jgi:hypothetical protein
MTEKPVKTIISVQKLPENKTQSSITESSSSKSQKNITYDVIFSQSLAQSVVN